MDEIQFALILNPLVGHIDEHAGQPILSGNNHSVLQIADYCSTFRICHLFVDEIKVKSLAKDVQGRDASRKHLIRYVHTLLLSNIWHREQNFPTHMEHE
jgi:hypothetical protein